MGALKALYDDEVLDSVKTISTVSGGGYIGYWLFSREYWNHSRPAERFGTKSFADAPFMVGVCDVATTGNFIGKWAAALKWMIGRKPVYAYEHSIFRTFGQANYDVPKSYKTGGMVDTAPIQFHQLRDLVVGGVIPNFVVTSRVYRPRPEYGFADGMYELTPFVRGTASRGFREWTGNTSYSILEGVSASGAAVAAPLDRTLPTEVSATGERIQLSDGGHGENLGALALIRRRIPNIIILDLEEDSKFKLEGYSKLKARLSVWGYTLDVPMLDTLRDAKGQRRPARGTHTGTLTGPGYAATVHYMKLSIPVSMTPVLRYDATQDGRALADRKRMFDVLERPDTAFSPDGKAWDCRKLAPLNVNLSSLGVHEIQKFLDPSDSSVTGVPPSWSDFPHVSTLTLKINVDRTMAQVALGYWLGKELAGDVKAGFARH